MGERREKVEVCDLCQKSVTNLRQSHFVPKFIAKDMKRASREGVLRSRDDPTKKQQDTFKAHAFCQSCETRMAKAETEFAQRIYHPRRKDALRKVTYQKWLLDFCVSMVWRAIAAPAYTTTNTHEVWYADGMSVDPDQIRTKLKRAFCIWREYLIGKRETLGDYGLHLYVIHPNAGGKPSLHAVLQESMVVCVPNQTLVWIRIPNILILGIIEDRKPEQWRGTRVHRQGGKMYFGLKEGSLEQGKPETYQRVAQGLNDYFQRENAWLQHNLEKVTEERVRYCRAR